LTPLAEDYGRKYIYTFCLIALYLLQIPCALAESITTLIVVRFVDGCLASPLLDVGSYASASLDWLHSDINVGCIPDCFTDDYPSTSKLSCERLGALRQHEF